MAVICCQRPPRSMVRCTSDILLAMPPSPPPSSLPSSLPSWLFISHSITFCASGRPTPLAMRKAFTAASVTPRSMTRAPFIAPKSRPDARDRGCVGKSGTISHNMTTSTKATGPHGPRPSTPPRNCLNRSSAPPESVPPEALATPGKRSEMAGGASRKRSVPRELNKFCRPLLLLSSPSPMGEVMLLLLLLMHASMGFPPSCCGFSSLLWEKGLPEVLGVSPIDVGTGLEQHIVPLLLLLLEQLLENIGQVRGAEGSLGHGGARSKEAPRSDCILLSILPLFTVNCCGLQRPLPSALSVSLSTLHKCSCETSLVN
mmetsp:Transcript_15690/g.42555  ORF Transcript_15690/g.42555 Transcript_15690/m.42555 type:complete len:315 (+) Transcript_15690:1275-2219(+)